VFGVYTELVEAIHRDDLDSVGRLAGQLCTPGFGSAPDLRVVTLTDRDLGTGMADLYRRFIDEDPDLGGALPPLLGENFADGEKRIRGAFALLDSAAPEMAEEVRALAREIVLVGHPTDESTPFDGASSFHLWGALFLNTDSYVSRIEIAEALAHESTHALLFGFAGGRTLVDNDPDARYSSPLRSDPRPMDGIVHATYVLARMHYVVSRLVQSGLLTDEEREFAAAALKRNAGRYAEGIGVVDSHAVWTPAGEAAIAGARAYMDGAGRP
jgi:HEXXH motif-containing protein